MALISPAAPCLAETLPPLEELAPSPVPCVRFLAGLPRPPEIVVMIKADGGAPVATLVLDQAEDVVRQRRLLHLDRPRIS